jgi:hypothetical protein
MNQFNNQLRFSNMIKYIPIRITSMTIIVTEQQSKVPILRKYLKLSLALFLALFFMLLKIFDGFWI